MKHDHTDPLNGRLTAIVEAASATVRDDQARFRLAVLYPAVVIGLALLGTAWTMVTQQQLITSLENEFQSPPVPAEASWPRVGLADLTLGLTGVVIAVALAAWIVRVSGLVGRHAGRAARCDVMAEITSAANETPPAQREQLATAVVQAINLPTPGTTSPLVSYAEAQSDIDSRAATLRATAAFYRSLDERQRQKARRLLPLAGSLIAGMAVLCYGVALFRPMAGLLVSLAAPQDAIGARGEQ